MASAHERFSHQSMFWSVEWLQKLTYMYKYMYIVTVFCSSIMFSSIYCPALTVKAGSQYDGRLCFVSFHTVPFCFVHKVSSSIVCQCEAPPTEIALTPSVVKKNAEEREKSVVTSTFIAEEKS